MKSVACMTVLSMMLLATRVTSVFGGPSPRLLNFVSTFSGLFSNSEQVREDAAIKAEPTHDDLALIAVAADIPDLRPDITFYFLETDNGKVKRKHVLVITEDAKGAFLITPHNLTDSDRFGDTIPDLADISLIKAEDLMSPRKDCVADFTEVTDGVYSGAWPDCVNMLNGRFWSYGNTLTCAAWAGEINFEGALEKGNLFPYMMKKLKSYPLPDYWTEGVDDWTPPCGNV